MHQTLRIPEILFNIFGHCSPPTISPPESNYNADLAVLARTCKAFQEPALDVLWEELLDLSPLVRCFPDACRLAEPEEQSLCCRLSGEVCYMLSRPLKDAEWNILRGYARRVRFIRGVPLTSLNEETMRLIFSLAPFTDPLFPHLRSLYCETFEFTPLHVAVPSLTTLHLNFYFSSRPPVREFFDPFGDRCPHIETFEVDIEERGIWDAEISHQICRWPNLRYVDCHEVALNSHAISHLLFTPTLKWLSFTLEDDLIHVISLVGSISNLTSLHIVSRTLDNVASFLPYLRLPAIEILRVIPSEYPSRQAIRLYWAAVLEACSPHLVTRLQLYVLSRRYGDWAFLDDEVLLVRLTFDDLRPCTAFAELRELHISFSCSVALTDADLLELALPRMEELFINRHSGWNIDVDGGGITLSGLVQLLRQRPSLNHLCLAIDTRTFTEIPKGLDVSFPPRRQLKINLLDSYILPEFVPGLVSVFTALGLDSSMLNAWGAREWYIRLGERRPPTWEHVLGMLSASRKKSLSSEM